MRSIPLPGGIPYGNGRRIKNGGLSFGFLVKQLLEADTTVGLGDVFGFGPGVFSAVQGADGVYFAYCFALGVKSKPRADIREFAAGAATEALAPAGF
jgi:hypothetical protein